MTAKRNETSNSDVSRKLLILHLIIFIALFIFLTPKVSAQLFPFISENRLTTFLDTSTSEKEISPRSYWEFREFYSPGSFIFDKKGISNTHTEPVLTNAEVTLHANAQVTPFLAFTSRKLHSVDYITTANSLDQIIDEITIDEKNLLLIKTDTERVYRKNSTTYVLLFLKSPDQMRTANGFFDYRIADKELTEGKYWFNVTVITH